MQCIKHEELAQLVLYSDKFYNFFTSYVVMETFDVASDAFVTLKDLLQRHIKIVATFLDPEGPNYSKFFNHYEMLINSDNYVTKRQALKVCASISFYYLLFCASLRI
jgi:calcium binding protein 39